MESRLDLAIRAQNLATKALRDVQKDLTALDKSGASMTRGMMASFGNMARTVGRHLFSLKTGIAALMITLGVRGLAKSFLDAATTGESLRMRLTALLGDAKEGARLFGDLAKFAARVPFEYREIMAAATQLSGIMKGGRTEIMQWMPLIADLAAATGLGIEITTGQVMRMLSAGAAAADMFRERGVSAMLGFTAGVQYSAEETKKILWDAWTKDESRFRGLTGEMAKSWEGMVSMLRDAWFQFRQAVMEAGLFDYLKGGLKLILDWINRLKKEGKLDDWAKKISDAVVNGLNAVARGVGSMLDLVIPTVQYLYAEVKNLWTELEPLAKWLKEARVGKIISDIYYFEGRITDLTKKLELLKNQYVKVSAEEGFYSERLIKIRGEIIATNKQMGDMAKELERLESLFKILVEPEITRLDSEDNYGKFRSKVEEVIETIEKLRASFRGLGGGARKAAEDSMDAWVRARRNLEEEFLPYLKEAARDSADVWASFRERVEETQTYIDKELEKAAKKRKELLEEMLEDDLAYQIKIINNTASTQREIEEAWRNIRRIIEEQNVGAVKGFKIGWDDAMRHFKSVGHLMYELGRDTAENIQRAFSDYLFDVMMGNIRSLKDAWKELCETLKQSLIRAAADAMANEAVQWLFSGGKGGKKGGDKGSIWDWLGLFGDVGSTVWGWLGSAWDWISGWFQTGGSVRKTGLYKLEGGEYVIPREKVKFFKGVFGTQNLDRVFGGKTAPGKRDFQTGGEIGGGQGEGRDDWLGQFFQYVKQVRGVQWLWENILAPIYYYVAGVTGAAGGVVGGGGGAMAAAAFSPGAFSGRMAPLAGGGTWGQNPLFKTLSGFGHEISQLWAAISPYLTVAGLGYLGGGILGSIIGPKWFGTTGQYGSYGGALGALGGYVGGGALGTTVGMMGGTMGGAMLAATIGSWIPVIGTVLGAILGAVFGSMIGPTPHSHKASITYGMTGEDLLRGNFGQAWIAVRSGHGRGTAKAQADWAGQIINEALSKELPQYQEKLNKLPLNFELAKAMHPFDLMEYVPAMRGGRSKHFAAWTNQVAGLMPDIVKQWWDMSLLGALLEVGRKHPDVFGPEPWRWWGGERYWAGRLGWSETGREVPFAGYFQRGGIVPRTGLAYVHEGERITPKEKAGQDVTQNFNFTINISGLGDQAIETMVRRKVIPEIEDKIKRYGHVRYTIKEAV